MLIHRKTIVSDICHQFIFSQTVRIHLLCWSWAADPHNVGDDLLVFVWNFGDRVFDWEVEPTVYQRKYWEHWYPKTMLLPGILERILRADHYNNNIFLITFTFFIPGFSSDFSCFLLSGKKMRIKNIVDYVPLSPVDFLSSSLVKFLPDVTVYPSTQFVKTFFDWKVRKYRNIWPDSQW